MNLLIIADKLDDYSLLTEYLTSKGFKTSTSSKKEDFYSLIRNKEIKIIILDLTKEEIGEFPLLKEIKNFDPLIEVIIIGTSVPPSKMAESIKLGATDYLARPLEIEVLQPVLKKIQDKSLLRRETYQLEKALAESYVFQGIVGKNPYMLEVFSLIERVAKYSVSVLITGETGTGKEMVAQAIHSLSPHQGKKIVICDCTAIPETLFESELFGYVKGAFTGADKAKDGLFKEADGGTIFLDELGEIPISVQSKLLRVLEEHQFRPLGSNKNVDVEVRVISATSRDLKEDIKQGNFREDLYHRINVFEIRLPPLRERKEDIPLLSRRFLGKFNKAYKKNVLGISQRAQKALLDYSWSGNVRQLENIIERAVMLCQEKFIDIKDLDHYLREAATEEEVSPPSPTGPLLRLDDVEKNHILEILKRVNSNKQKAAEILGLSRQALYRKLKKHEIPF
ncbi:MAG: response regulator [Candidatus Aminicenantes bacterium]|nr:response regulator [Candidatus Aminicenantes bacterium]